MKERAEQPWLWGAWTAHPAFRFLYLEGANRGSGTGRAEYGSLKHIPGPVVADRHPQCIRVQPQQPECRSARQHPQQLLRIQP